MLDHIDKLKLNNYIVDNQIELEKILKNESYNYIIIDDAMKRLKFLKILSKYSKPIVYAQILFGVHAISPVFNHTALPLRHKILYLTTTLLPFSLIRKNYLNSISKATLVIANSKTTDTLLYTLYGVKSQGTVYPPVDTDIFKPMPTRIKKQVILYLGSGRGDTDPFLQLKYADFLNEKI